MARVRRPRNLGYSAEKRAEACESGQLLNIFVMFLGKSLIQETRSQRGCNLNLLNCIAEASCHRLD
jgi:hypothetical protein